jgi:CheY-like chemotaxis protein
MKRSVLIIDDVKEQAESLRKILSRELENTSFSYASSEEEIIFAIENMYFTIAIVDLRMDKYKFDGITLIKRIFEINPFSKIIIVSAFTGEYFSQIKDLLTSGKIIDIIEKTDFATFSNKIKNVIENYHNDLFEDPSEINSALLEFYSQAKNEKNTFQKGEQFEHFISLIFQSIGFNNVNKRIIDKSLNEVDLIIRNDIEDSFLCKFGKYILVECKNKPDIKVDKNTFIVFNNKLKNTNGLSELGIIATTGYITKNTYYEAIRESGESRKIIFLSNPELQKLILSKNKLEDFKRILDTQVKDN